MQKLELSVTDEATGRTVARSMSLSDVIVYDPWPSCGRSGLFVSLCPRSCTHLLRRIRMAEAKTQKPAARKKPIARRRPAAKLKPMKRMATGFDSSRRSHG